MNDAATTAELTLNMEAVLAYLADLNTKESDTKCRVTLTHFWIKSFALCFEKYPDMNCALIGKKLIARKYIDIFLTVMIREKGELNRSYDLSGISIRDAQFKSLRDIAVESNQKILALRTGVDHPIRRVRKLAKLIPSPLAPLFLGLVNRWVYTLNLSLEWLGLPGDRFGSALLSNFGALGIEKAILPLYPFSRTPYAVGIGNVRLTPFVEGENIVAANCTTLSLTMDHRVIDGFQGAKFMKYLQKISETPYEYLGK